jgi:hypothetical protein
MNYEQFIRELDAAGISGRELGRLLGFHKNSISNYSLRGAVPTHLAVIARLLRVLADHDIPFRDKLGTPDLSPGGGRARAAAPRDNPDKDHPNR